MKFHIFLLFQKCCNIWVNISAFYMMYGNWWFPLFSKFHRFSFRISHILSIWEILIRLIRAVLSAAHDTTHKTRGQYLNKSWFENVEILQVVARKWWNTTFEIDTFLITKRYTTDTRQVARTLVHICSLGRNAQGYVLTCTNTAEVFLSHIFDIIFWCPFRRWNRFPDTFFALP
jgi:hypothetical protein